jgi:hypothetical protein
VPGALDLALHPVQLQVVYGQDRFCRQMAPP